MFKKSEQLTDGELRQAYAQLALQVDALEKVMLSVSGLLLTQLDEADPPPDDVFRAMVEMLLEYTRHIVDVHQHIEAEYAAHIASTN